MKKYLCHVCLRSFGVHVNGKLRAHKHWDGSGPCEGVGSLPMEKTRAPARARYQQMVSQRSRLLDEMAALRAANKFTELNAKDGELRVLEHHMGVLAVFLRPYDREENV